MKTFLGFITGICVGAIGFTVLLIVTPETDKLLKTSKDFAGMD